MTLPESPPIPVGWNGGRGVESYRLTGREGTYGRTNGPTRTPTTEPTRKYLFPPMATSRRSPPATSESSSIVTSSSSRNGQDSLLNNSFHSRNSSETSESWSHLGMGDKRGSSSSDGMGYGSMGGRRNTLPPLADLLELGHTELSKKGLPPTPPYSHYSFACSTTPINGNGGGGGGGKGFGHPPPAPSSGARINNYHHHPHPRPTPPTTQPSRQRVSTADSDMSSYGGLPKLERLRISPNSIRSSIVSSKSSIISRGSERDSFYSFAASEEDGGGDFGRDRDGDGEGMDQMVDTPSYYTPSPTSATPDGPLIPSFTNRSQSQSKNLLSDATLPPILSHGTGLGFSGGLPTRPTRLPSLSQATNCSTSMEGLRKFDFEFGEGRGDGFDGLFEGRNGGRLGEKRF